MYKYCDFAASINVTVPDKSSSFQDPVLRALTAAVDQLDTADSGLTSCDSGWWATVQDERCHCQWSPRRLAGGRDGQKEMSHNTSWPDGNTATAILFSMH